MRRFVCCICAVLIPLSTTAQSYSNTSSVVDGSGRSSGGGSYSNISAAAQPGGVSGSLGGTFVNDAGFLNTFSLRTSLDTDNDGLANEVDADNDNDSLGDVVELAGTAFDPNTATDPNNADGDNDGQDDGEEAGAGTDPGDDRSLLMITGIDPTPDAKVTWIGRGGMSYDIYCGGDLSMGFSELLTATNVTGGIAPWYVTTNSFVDTTASSTNRRFYLIKVRP